MNKRPIEEAQNPALRGSHAALKRSALRAWELARQTGTAVVVMRNGVLEHIYPTATDTIPPTTNNDETAVKK